MHAACADDDGLELGLLLGASSFGARPHVVEIGQRLAVFIQRVEPDLVPAAVLRGVAPGSGALRGR
jgi:hypothetical protein